jgi:hypothetical protein
MDATINQLLEKLRRVRTPEELAAEAEEEERESAPEREREALLEKERLEEQTRLEEEERLRQAQQEKEEAELVRSYKEEIRRHRSVYRFTKEELDEIKYELGSVYPEEMVHFLVGHKYDRSARGYYYLWGLPWKVGRKGIFDINKNHWSVPCQDLIWFWTECRRDGRSEDEWNFHTAVVEIKQWLRMVNAGESFKAPMPSLVKYHQEQRQKALRRSLADLFQQGKLGSIMLGRQFQDGRMKSKRVSVLSLRRALQEADPQTWEYVQKDEFWTFILAWMEQDNGHLIKFESQFKKFRNSQQVLLVLTLNKYETQEEEETRERDEWFAKDAARHAEEKRIADELKKRIAVGKAVAEVEEKKKEEELIAAIAARTPEEKEERNKQRWLNMMKKTPFLFVDFLKEDPSLSRYIPEDCDFPFQIHCNAQ